MSFLAHRFLCGSSRTLSLSASATTPVCSPPADMSPATPEPAPFSVSPFVPRQRVTSASSLRAGRTSLASVSASSQQGGNNPRLVSPSPSVEQQADAKKQGAGAQAPRITVTLADVRAHQKQHSFNLRDLGAAQCEKVCDTERQEQRQEQRGKGPALQRLTSPPEVWRMLSDEVLSPSVDAVATEGRSRFELGTGVTVAETAQFLSRRGHRERVWTRMQKDAPCTDERQLKRLLDVVVAYLRSQKVHEDLKQIVADQKSSEEQVWRLVSRVALHFRREGRFHLTREQFLGRLPRVLRDVGDLMSIEDTPGICHLALTGVRVVSDDEDLC